MADDNLGNELDGTIETLSADLGTINPANALGSIEKWQQRLQQEGRPELTKISDSLGQLKATLTSGKLDGREIGKLLLQLGQQTGAAAQAGQTTENFDAGTATKLKSLASALTKLGNAISY